MAIRINVTPTEAEKATTFAELPDDRDYLLEVDEIEVRQGPKGPYFNARLKVIEPDEFADSVMYDIWTIPREENLDDPVAREKELKRSFRLFQFVAAAELKWDTDFGEDDLLGLRVRCTVENEEYEGKPRSRPDRYLKV